MLFGEDAVITYVSDSSNRSSRLVVMLLVACLLVACSWLFKCSHMSLQFVPTQMLVCCVVSVLAPM
jgi:hypothetical protein